MLGMGIDIGTTTISVIMIDSEDGTLAGRRTVEHKSFLKGDNLSNKIQSPERIWSLTAATVMEMIREYGTPASIGMTGQMHGMLYTDKNGDAVSPLYTWQDGSGNEPLENGKTASEMLKEAGCSSASGYGLTTHFYLMKKGLVPENAVKMATISDYIAMKLCGEKSPCIARDMAASWGCFDIEKGDFKREKLEELGMDPGLLPQILTGHPVIGKTTSELVEGIPVTVSLGDNQASVLGSVKNLADTVLVNIGTGSQVSFGTPDYRDAQGSIELRPCTEKLYLMAGSGLCGGRAYAMLEQFYREAGEEEAVCYERMERQAREFLENYGKDAIWNIRTTFSGTRSNPEERGSISGIGVENFHPGAMTAGMLQGILNELFEMYESMCEMTGRKAVHLVGSGNAVRKNGLLREMAQELFGMEMSIPECGEEAAYGAALQALASAGIAESMEKMQQKIRYQ